MAVTYNIKGTTYDQFQVGKSGPKLVKSGSNLELQTTGGSVIAADLSTTNLTINTVAFPDPTGATSGQYLKYNSGSMEWAVVPEPTTFTPITATGTGASQNITLPYSGLTVNDVNVFVDGLKYLTSEYTISGTTLTLTTNASGDSIEITCPVVLTGAGSSITPVSIVQKAASGSTSTGGTVSLTSPATLGNMIVAVYCGGRWPNTPSGFDQLFSMDNVSQTIFVYRKISTGGEQNFTCTSSDNGQWVIYELAHCHSLNWSPNADYFNSGTFSKFIPGSAYNGSITILAVEHDGPSAMTMTATGLTIDFPGGASGNNHVGTIGHGGSDFEGMVSMSSGGSSNAAWAVIWAFPLQTPA